MTDQSDEERVRQIIVSSGGYTGITRRNENNDDETTTVNVENIPQDDGETKDENKEDEVKETKRPLLNNDEDEPKEVIVISKNDAEDEDNSEINETPTLPVSYKGGDVFDQIDKEREKRPSVFTQPFARMKYDWEHSVNLVEFFSRVICVIFASIGWIILVGGIPFISIIQLIIGSVYLYDCPADHRIPEYLIVTGVFGTILHGVSVCTKYGPKFAPKSAQEQIQVNKRRCLCIETILQIFLFIWFIAGCTWVYSIYEPDYIHTEYDEYCHKGLYLFSFWMLNIQFFFLFILIALVLCAISVIAFDKEPCSKTKNISS